MKKLLIQYLWIFSITAAILLVALLTFPKKEDKLKYILKEVERVQDEQKALTQKEKELIEKAFEKEWEEVDKNKDK